MLLLMMVGFFIALPAESVIQEVCVEVLPSGDESDGDKEEGDRESEEHGADEDRPGPIAQLETARADDRHHPQAARRRRTGNTGI